MGSLAEKSNQRGKKKKQYAFHGTWSPKDSDTERCQLPSRMVLTSASSARLRAPAQDNPALGTFLEFLACDVAEHPQRVQALDGASFERIRAWVCGIEVDLDAALAMDGEQVSVQAKISPLIKCHTLPQTAAAGTRPP